MYARCLSAFLLAGSLAGSLSAQQTNGQVLGITLGRPQPIMPAASSAPAPASAPARSISLRAPQPIIRGQSPDVPPVVVPPPPPPPGAPGGGLNLPSNEEAYNCGVVNNNADQGGFFARVGDRFQRGWQEISGNVGGMFQGGPGRGIFQSDHAFDSFVSPVSNPFFFEDPRALTEVRPMFIWQQTNDQTPFFAGGNNYFAGLQARVALTENLSLVVNRLGWQWIRPDAPAGEFQDADGFSTLHVGPKLTFYRGLHTGTIAAAGLNFEIPTGPKRIFQDTGDLSLSPYLSFGQEFWKGELGSFHFLTTWGYSFGIDSERTDFLYGSLHLDYGIKNWNLYPLVELNWFHYTSNGSVRNLNFEGNNLFNFGSRFVNGNDDLTIAVGARYKLSEAIQFGVAAEFGLLGGPRHMDGFRLLFDVIFRY